MKKILLLLLLACSSCVDFKTKKEGWNYNETNLSITFESSILQISRFNHEPLRMVVTCGNSHLLISSDSIQNIGKSHVVYDDVVKNNTFYREIDITDIVVRKYKSNPYEIEVIGGRSHFLVKADSMAYVSEGRTITILN